MSDLIDRQAAIEALANGALINYQATGSHNGLVKAIDVIKGLPSAERKEAHWKALKHYVSPLHEAFVVDYECSNCHFQLGELEWNYCPICGSRMEDHPCRE